MATNEFGVRLDRNGYATSIMDDNEEACYLCGSHGLYGKLERHEIFFGSGYREKSKRHGLWANLCCQCHRTGPQAVHSSGERDRALKAQAQARAMTVYNWDIDQFRAEYGKNYL